MQSNSHGFKHILNIRIRQEILAVLLMLGISLLITGGCSGKTGSDSAISSVTNSEVTREVNTTAPSPTDTLTVTPTPTCTPTPSPSPTPIPEYIEPEYETVWYNGFVDPRSVRAEVISNPDDILAVVNKYYALPDDWVPNDLVDAPYSYDQQLRSEANDAWVLMHDACLNDIDEAPLLVSGFRTKGTQEYLFQRSANKNGYAFACQKNALPGRSEHQLGLALDITTSYWSNISDNFASTQCGQWVNEHCYEYGFILRYQEQYTDETGYGIEAWHYRYVGIDTATYLYEHDMSLEAYLGKAQILPGDE